MLDRDAAQAARDAAAAALDDATLALLRQLHDAEVRVGALFEGSGPSLREFADEFATLTPAQRAAAGALVPALEAAARTAGPGMTLAALAVAGSSVLFILGLGHLQVAEATAINFISPIFITALSIPLLGEKVGIRRWAAAAVGFLGVMLVVQPGGSAFQIAALLPIGAIQFDPWVGTVRASWRKLPPDELVVQDPRYVVGNWVLGHASWVAGVRRQCEQMTP